MTTADAIKATLESSNVADSNGDFANVVDVLANLGNGIWSMSKAIKDGRGVANDDTGGVVGSLTEAVMGVTSGLCKIADAINNLAEAVRERNEPQS